MRTRASYGVVVPLPILGLLLAMLLAFAAGCGSSTGADKGSPAPDFSGTTLDGQRVSLSMYRGKPLVLAFTASW